MAYITAEEIAVKRNALKEAFPGWKFRVTRERYSGVRVAIMEAPINFLALMNGRDSVQLNPHYMGESFRDCEDQPELVLQAQRVLVRIKEIVSEGNFDKSDSQIDYFHVGFYESYQIGKYDKGFVYNPNIKGPKPKNETRKETAPANIEAGAMPEGVFMVQYSEKSVAVYGNTYPIKHVMKTYNGRFNKFLNINNEKTAGWIFTNKDAEELQKLWKDALCPA